MKAPSHPTPPPPNGGTSPSSPAGGSCRGLVFMVISLSGFTANTLLLKELGSNRHVDPAVALLFRAVIGGVILLAFLRGHRPPQLKPIFTEPLLIWRGILGILGTAAFYFTIAPLGAGKASLLGTTYVLFGAVFAALFLREHLSLRKIVWLLFAFGGTALLTGVGNGANSIVAGIGPYEMLAIGGAIAAAGTIVIIRQLTKTHGIATIFLAQCVYIGAATLPFAWNDFGKLQSIDYLLLSLAAVAAGYGQLAMNEGYRLLSVAAGSSVQMALPVLAAIGGFFLFGELFAPLQLVGAAMILLGTWQVAVRGKSKTPPRPA